MPELPMFVGWSGFMLSSWMQLVYDTSTAGLPA